MPALGVTPQPWEQSILASAGGRREHPQPAPRGSPAAGGRDEGCGAVQPPVGLSSRRWGWELSPSAWARLGSGGGFALFTLQLWLWLEFVKGSG